jgi:hypothetical protein
MVGKEEENKKGVFTKWQSNLLVFMEFFGPIRWQSKWISLPLNLIIIVG